MTHTFAGDPEDAFYGCSLLADVTIGNSITEIGTNAFRNCTALESIIIPNTTITMGGSMFIGCKSLTNVVIGNSVESIEDDTFFGCSALANVIIGNAVKSIDSRAFYNCTALTKIILPSVATIYSEAFHGCSSLETVVIPQSVTYIHSNAFKDCTADLYLDCNIPDEAYWFQNSSFKKVVIGENVTTIGAHAFQNCNSIVSFTMGRNVETIGVRAFEGCKSLLSITIPPKVESIENMAFLGCTSLEEVVIEDGNTPLSLGSNNYSYPGEGQFSDSPLETIYIGRDLEYNSSIYYGYSPFNDVGSIKTVMVGNHVTSLGENLFSSVDTLRLLNLNPPFANPFNTSIYQGTILEVPYGTLEEYGNAEVWKEFHHTRESGDFYTLTYMIDGQIYVMDSIASGVPIHLISPTKEGYTFSGWSEVPETMPENDLTVSGTFIKNKYLVTFKIGDEIIAADSLEYGSAIVAPDAPEKEGYTFNGWGEIAETVPVGDLIYEGSYSVNSYILTYTVDGEVVQADSVAYGTSITLLEEPTKEGYTFSGWSEAPETMPAEDVTISGTFTVNKYLVTFKIGDEVIAVDSLEYGATVVAPEAPEKEGYTFNGWGDVVETVPANDLTYEGSYSVNSYLLTYTVNGETVQADSVAYGTAITLLEEPEKEGHTFSGWSEAPETMPASDVIIRGTFTINKYLVTFKIGDEVIAVDSLEYGNAIIAPDAPEKEGYTFDGWSEIPEVVPANDITIEGSYSVNSYLLTYTVDGETIQADSVVYGTAIILLEEPTKEGHTFSGWSEAPETMPANDVVISGTFTINKYLVTFKIGDEVIAADSLGYGSAIVVPEAPAKEGYTFDGWGEVAETVPAGDVTCEGTYSVNIYKVYYYVGEELVHTAEVAYGEAIPEYVYEPTEEGYTFLGWVGDTYETMPAHDVVYTANIDNGIQKLTNDKSQWTIYDLAGRKVLDTENLKGGIYIVNGKKVIVK